MSRQLVLKPQDLLVVLKLAANKDRNFVFAELGGELDISTSEAHACVRRSLQAGLLVMSGKEAEPVRFAIEEFLLHGVRYCFPATFGPIALGLPTAGAGPVLERHFVSDDSLAYVWPDPKGTVRGSTLYPLYPSVPVAALNDVRLYEMLTLVDALRAGSARERELATIEMRRRLL